jgi:hypothetical protein
MEPAPAQSTTFTSIQRRSSGVFYGLPHKEIGWGEHPMEDPLEKDYGWVLPSLLIFQ